MKSLDWFSMLFLAAFVISLLTGKAYFRGVHGRDENPRMYWSTVVCYAVLAALIPVLRLIKG